MDLLKTIEANLKGVMAEQLAKELLIDAKCEVFYYGVEHLVPGFTSRIEVKKKDRSHKTNNVISNLPDFLVVKDGKSYYIEVKFRMNGKLKLKEDYPFPDAYFLLFSKDNIFIALAKDLIDGSSAFEVLTRDNPFGIQAETIESCKLIQSKYFCNI